MTTCLVAFLQTRMRCALPDAPLILVLSVKLRYYVGIKRILRAYKPLKQDKSVSVNIGVSSDSHPDARFMMALH